MHSNNCSNENSPNHSSFQASRDTESNYGLFNHFIYPTMPTASDSQEQNTHLRLNMIHLYLKFLIQTLLYLSLAFVVFTTAAWCAKFFTCLTVGILLLGAIQMAILNMYRNNNTMTNTDPHLQLSIVDAEYLSNAAKACVKTTIDCVENTANWAVGFFAGFKFGHEHNNIVSNILDPQIPHILKDNSITQANYSTPY